MLDSPVLRSQELRLPPLETVTEYQNSPSRASKSPSSIAAGPWREALWFVGRVDDLAWSDATREGHGND